MEKLDIHSLAWFTENPPPPRKIDPPKIDPINFPLG